MSYFEDAAWHSVVWDVMPAGDGSASAAFVFDGGVYGVEPQPIPSYALPADVFLGFTGRTGGATNNHWARNIQYGIGGGGGGGGANCDASVTAVDSVDGWETYQLGLTLTNGASNVYTIFGDASTSLSMPAAYQEATPFGANVGGVNPAFIAVSATAAVDSWLSVGPTDGSAGGGISSVGIDWDSWTADSGLSADNGAVFWMVPDNGPSGSAVVAQVTIADGASGTATMGAQGRSASGADWVNGGITFNFGA